MLVHVEPREHVLVSAVQYKPAPIVHPVSPQRHGAVLDVVPSVSRQLGAEKHRQYWEYLEEQDIVEVVLEL